MYTVDTGSWRIGTPPFPSQNYRLIYSISMTGSYLTVSAIPHPAAFPALLALLLNAIDALHDGGGVLPSGEEVII